ncbi:MAG: type II secretion system protein [Acidimicrobiia bacterium]
MRKSLHKVLDRRDAEEGFTLIELMVVVLIIAILIAIAVPTFLGARQRAQNASAKSSLRNAFANAKSIYTDNEDYTQATPAALLAAEPSLTFNNNSTASTGAKNVSVKTTTTDLVIVAKAASGTCYGLHDSSAGGTGYATVSGACTADNAAATATWGSSW